MAESRGFTNTAMSLASGITWRISSMRFVARPMLRFETPVTLPPGRLRLATSPIWTGSAPAWKTIGTVVVAAFAASAAGVVTATITVTWR